MMAKKMGKDYKYWKAGARYGYGAIDEYDETGSLNRTVIAGITQKLAKRLAREHNYTMDMVAPESVKKKIGKLGWLR